MAGERRGLRECVTVMNIEGEQVTGDEGGGTDVDGSEGALPTE